MESIGILNSQNQCFLNSILQVLNIYRELFSAESKNYLEQELALLLEQFDHKTEKVLDITTFKSFLNKMNPTLFQENQQTQDASEVLLWLLEQTKKTSLFEIRLFNNETQFPLHISIPQLYGYLYFNNHRLYLPNICINQIVPFLENRSILSTKSAFFYSANYYSLNEINLNQDISFFDLFREAKDHQQSLFLIKKPYGDFNLFKIKLMKHQFELWRQFSFIQPIFLESDDFTMKNIEEKIMKLVKCQTVEIMSEELNQNQIIEIHVYENESSNLDEINNFRDFYLTNKLQINIMEEVKNIKEFPEVLIIQLNRFRLTADKQLKKINKRYQFPIYDLNQMYDLVAIINHVGECMEGHYTVFKRQLNDIWVCIDNDKVYTISEKNVITKSAYLLVYENKYRIKARQFRQQNEFYEEKPQVMKNETSNISQDYSQRVNELIQQNVNLVGPEYHLKQLLALEDFENANSILNKKYPNVVWKYQESKDFKQQKSQKDENIISQIIEQSSVLQDTLENVKEYD